MIHKFWRFVLIFVSGLFGMLGFDGRAASIADNLSGRILLQVESKGEAWWVSPVTKLRHYLGRPHDAFAIMRRLGLGITNQDLSKIVVVSDSQGSSSDGGGDQSNESSNQSSGQTNTCVVTGCSGQLCADTEMSSTCEFKEEYACYQLAKCERQSNGHCGWTQSAELTQCIMDAQQLDEY